MIHAQLAQIRQCRDQAPSGTVRHRQAPSQISDRIQAHLQAEKAQMNSNLKPQFSAHVEKVGASNPSSGERDMSTRHFTP